ncbi:hypothetical protein G5I_13505 [Acromyrmex echinatior]|uniref:Uncharacterized protein n=1 Tax=Acromyrmex echinatior TaxID=103372 RepID=F4X580_ACREC|nr:hypothetical protein G5I_13505 [Acromyrmex echinatior]
MQKNDPSENVKERWLLRLYPRCSYAYFILFLSRCKRFVPAISDNTRPSGKRQQSRMQRKLDRIARGMFPSALYSSRNHDNCRRVTVSSAALGQLVQSRFRVYSKRDERKGEKEPAEA